MIDISLWRAVIGLWIFTRGIAKEKKELTLIQRQISLWMQGCRMVIQRPCIPYTSCIIFCAFHTSLCCSGNVELNPGPTFIECTSCFKVNSI